MILVVVIIAGVAVAEAACERTRTTDEPPPRPPPSPPPSPPADARPSDAAIACSSDRDCPQLPAGSTCAFTCGPDTCQLVAVSAKPGAGPCFGTQRDGARAITIQPDSQVFVACDVNAGLYCEHSTRRCARSKPRGTACQADDECGDDGRCDDTSRQCVQAEPQGAACHTQHCGRGLFCNDRDRCEPRHAEGAACVLADDCASHACDRERCVAAPASFACALSVPAW
ncbi:MAG: hypothetical protein ABJE66_31150 [Deltaproteobacteria bacterium]